MKSETETNTILGIHLRSDGFFASFYRNGMNEAQLIHDPDTDDTKWPIACFQEGDFDAEVFSEALQNGLDRIYGLLEDSCISHITFSAGKMSEERIKELKAVFDGMDLKYAGYDLLEDDESFYDFVTFQNNDLWKNEVVYLEERDKKLYAKSLVSASYPHEKALTVITSDFPEFDFGNEDAETDRRFYLLLERFFAKRVISCVFLEGKTFSKNWMNQTLKFLCRGRRVFGIEDMVVKGACYRALRRNISEIRNGYFMGSHQLPFSISMTVTNNQKDELCRLVRAGVNWYEADITWNFMINDADKLHFQTDPVLPGFTKYIDVDVSWMPKRPEFATKAAVSVHFDGKDKWSITVTDLGLGEIYPSDNKNTTVYISRQQS